MIDFTISAKTELESHYQAAHDQFADAAMRGDQVEMDRALAVISELCEKLRRNHAC